MSLKPLVALCSVLMLAPVEARAAPMEMGLGLGYVRGECGLTNAAGENTCFSGGRAELQVTWLVHNPLHQRDGHDDSDDGASDRSADFASHAYSGPNLNLIPAGGNGKAAAAALVLTVAVIVVAFGVYFAALGLLASRITLGGYYSYDFQQASWASTGDLSRYQAHRLGVQTGLYFFPRFDLALVLGAGPALARLSTTGPSGRDDDVLRGISSKIGLGYVPATGSGPIILYEFEGTFFNGASLAKYVKQNVTTRLPTVRHSGAGLVGWSLGF